MRKISVIILVGFIILLESCSDINEVELGMTTEEVREILGEPDFIEVDVWDGAIVSVYFHYPDGMIEFIDGIVVDIYRD
jgi:hypothetical protein